MTQPSAAKKIRIEHNTVQETLVIPLYGRKICTERFPNLFRDDKAMELIERLDYDFSGLEKQAKSLAHQFGALEVAMRENDLMIETRAYLQDHPKATLVNLGCGLDQTAENVDNGQCRIVNIDMPDVIAVRDRLLPASERVRNLGCDLNDPAWMDEIDPSDGVCLMAAGVFYYFKTEDIKKLFFIRSSLCHNCLVLFRERLIIIPKESTNLLVFYLLQALFGFLEQRKKAAILVQ